MQKIYKVAILLLCSQQIGQYAAAQTAVNNSQFRRRKNGEGLHYGKGYQI
jgi:hypothetical protein